MTVAETHRAIDAVWRIESAKLIAGLTRIVRDVGVAEVVELPREETERHWRETTPQWPIMHAVLKGITRDQMMARHKANHIQVRSRTTDLLG